MESNNYEVWILGYDENSFLTDYEYLVGTFKSEQEATEVLREFRENKALIESLLIPENVKTLSIEVELVIEHEDGSTENVDTIYAAILDF